jgi:hypothetical protein
MIKKRKKVYRRSGFEDEVEAFLKDNKIKYEYEPKDKKLAYNIPESFHKYVPDFVVGDIILEPKGHRFNEKTERDKYLHLKRCHPNQRIIIIFQNPRLKIYKGSPTTFAMWCDKNNIEWCSFKTLHTKLNIK